MLSFDLDCMYDLFESASIVEQTDGQNEEAKAIDEGYDAHECKNQRGVFNLPVLGNTIVR